MSRFYEPALYDRRNGAPNRPDDGLSGAYAATVRTTRDASGNVTVVIASLSINHFYVAKCPVTHGTGPNVGDPALVIFDENKHPWVVSYGN